jgi:hypothetical protein
MATICVAPTSSGNGLGGDWSNCAAKPSITGWVRGNIYYLADGDYGTLAVNTQ